MTSESPIWKINKKSRIKVGSGMIRRKTIRTTNAVTTLLDKLENFFNLTQIPFILAVNVGEDLGHRIVEFLWYLHADFN